MQKEESKKIIIFGAGNYGKMALDYFGIDNVEYYADNNSTKVGTTYCGKEVLSFQDFLARAKEYNIVVALNTYTQVAQQLQENGVYNFSFFSPQYGKVIEKLKLMVTRIQGKVAFVGIDNCTEILLRDLERNGFDVRNLYMSEMRGEVLIGQNFSGYTVYDIEELILRIDTVIISSARRAYALQVYVKNLKKDGLTVINPFIQNKYYETQEIIYNPYGETNHTTTEEEWNAVNKNNHVIESIKEYVEELAKHQPLFEHIEIETVNRCNGVCDFCPVSVRHDIRKEKFMDEELFKSIINQLADIRYSGRLATFSNNEPFLDERIIIFNEYARKMLPDARLHLFTNGTLLTLDKFIQIIEYLDELIIDNYNQKLELNLNSRKVKEYCELHPELKDKVTIVLRKQQEILTTRGGEAPNRVEKHSYPDAKCVLPFKQIIIRPDGKVSLCCNDPYGRYTLGDLNKDSLLDIWYGEACNEIRKKLLIGRSEVEQCRQCDTFILF